MSMKVPAIVDEVKKALSQDMAVVIGLQTTGEVCSVCVYIHVHMSVAHTLKCVLPYSLNMKAPKVHALVMCTVYTYN